MSNEFENPHDQRNDLIDSGVGFVVTFGFFMTVFAIFTVFGVLKDLNS
ncbi:YqzM family protein [Caldalkalibacillus salinus]|nr:YqzM family protein [Caldalkalibacillus salinus]